MGAEDAPASTQDLEAQSLLYIARVTEVMSGLEANVGSIVAVARLMRSVLDAGGTIFWFGNGGSAGDAQHLAAELIGRFQAERNALRSISLTADSAVLSAISNDYGFAEVFARQIHGLCRSGDLAVGISTSGSSTNVLRGLEEARACGAHTVALTGSGPRPIREYADICLEVPSTVTCHIQECHLVVGQLLCCLVDSQGTS